MKLSNLLFFNPKSRHGASFGKNEGLYPFFTSSNGVSKRSDLFDFDSEALIIGDGGTGNCKYYKGKFAVSDHNYVATSKNPTVPLKVIQYFLMKDGYKILNDGFKGVGIRNVSKSYIEDIEFHVNKKYSFETIISSLDEIEKAINTRNIQLQELDSLVKSRFNEMLGEYDLTSQKPEWKQIKDIATVMTGTTPVSGEEANWGGDILWITPAEMNEDSFIITDTERKITEQGRKSKSLQLMPINTVLLSTRAPIGKVGIVGKEMCCNQGFKNFVFKPSVVNPIYAYWLLKMNNDYLQSIGTGTTFKEISKSNAERIRIPTPDINKQIEFADFVQLIDKSKFIVQQQIKNLQELLDSKMDEYFGDDLEAN